MKKNIVKLNENTLRQIVAESVKKVLKETELDYDIDNFSGRFSRGNRYNILVDGDIYYRDVPEESVQKLVLNLEREGHDNVEVVDLNDDGSEKEPENILHWYDNVEKTYDMIAMIKSDMNPIQQSFKAASLQDAIQQAMKYFTRFTGKGEKDVDIYYIRHHEYDGF